MKQFIFFCFYLKQLKIVLRTVRAFTFLIQCQRIRHLPCIQFFSFINNLIQTIVQVVDKSIANLILLTEHTKIRYFPIFLFKIESWFLQITLISKTDVLFFDFLEPFFFFNFGVILDFHLKYNSSFSNCSSRIPIDSFGNYFLLIKILQFFLFFSETQFMLLHNGKNENLCTQKKVLTITESQLKLTYLLFFWVLQILKMSTISF